MNIVLLVVGKTSEDYLAAGILEYQKRLCNYIRFSIIEISNVKKNKKTSKFEIIRDEGVEIFKHINSSDYVVLLDEKGESFQSVNFAQKLQSWMMMSKKRLVFIVGGSYGFSSKIYDRGDEQLSLSKMTFSHQMIRLFFTEQLYRAFSILNKQPYHNN